MNQHNEKIQKHEKELEEQQAALKQFQDELTGVKDWLRDDKNNGEGSNSTIASS